MAESYNFSLRIQFRELETRVHHLEKLLLKRGEPNTTGSPKPSEPPRETGIRATALTLKEFLRAYPIGRTTTLKEIDRGALKAQRFGTKYLIMPEDAEQWFKSRLGA